MPREQTGWMAWHQQQNIDKYSTFQAMKQETPVFGHLNLYLAENNSQSVRQAFS